MSEELRRALGERGFRVYPGSVRRAEDGSTVFVAASEREKFVGLARPRDAAPLASPVLTCRPAGASGEAASLYRLDWTTYQHLCGLLSLRPSRCDRATSFGTGDRLGLVTAVHAAAAERYSVFPVLAQQSPRELVRTGRDFRVVLMDAVMGVLEAGCVGPFGADADHIRDQAFLMQGIEAGYTMYTLDLSEWTTDTTGWSNEELARRVDTLLPLSRRIISGNGGAEVAVRGEAPRRLSEDELTRSAVAYEGAMRQVIAFSRVLRERLPAFDLEVSIDEGKCETTLEDHLFVVEYLRSSGVEFQTLAPRFPGEFQKGVAYRGDPVALTRAVRAHQSLCEERGGYRLSLHSGSDKFSVYPLFSEATKGRLHVKTSGTSWAQAVRALAQETPQLVRELYPICLASLADAKKAYHVSIDRTDFPDEPPDDMLRFVSEPAGRQLFHICYGALLDAKREEILAALRRHEAEHYRAVDAHIQAHLRLLCAAAAC